MGKSAIVLGASGVTGTELMKLLIEDEEFDQIIVIPRSKGKLEHPKIKEIITDLLHLEQVTSECKADVLFCCIGTTKAQTPDKTTYKAIDYGIPVQAAKIAKANGINTFIVVSALGADPNSRIFYNKTKGEMERDVLAQHLKKTYLLQPSLIDFLRDRFAEKIGVYLMRLINPLLVGRLKKYRSITPKTIARAMKELAKNNYPTSRISSDQITLIANGKL